MTCKYPLSQEFYNVAVTNQEVINLAATAGGDIIYLHAIGLMWRNLHFARALCDKYIKELEAIDNLVGSGDYDPTFEPFIVEDVSITDVKDLNGGNTPSSTVLYGEREYKYPAAGVPGFYVPLSPYPGSGYNKDKFDLYTFYLTAEEQEILSYSYDEDNDFLESDCKNIFSDIGFSGVLSYDNRSLIAQLVLNAKAAYETLLDYYETEINGETFADWTPVISFAPGDLPDHPSTYTIFDPISAALTTASFVDAKNISPPPPRKYASVRWDHMSAEWDAIEHFNLDAVLNLLGTPVTFGLSEEEYQDKLAAGEVVGPCEAPVVPFSPEDCPPCIKNPTAVVPDWRAKDEGDVFLNQRTCNYCVTVVSSEVDVTILNDASSRQTFLEAQKTKGVELILDSFNKSPLDPTSMQTVVDEAKIEEYEVPLRNLMPIKSMICVPVSLIDSIQPTSTAEDAENEDIEDPPVGPVGCVLEASKVRLMVRQVCEAFRYYGHQYAMWSHETGQVIPNFNPKEEIKQLKKFVPALVRLMNRNGFKLNGPAAVETVELRFDKNYEVIYAQVKAPYCEPVELLWKKDGDNLGGFKSLNPINDPRTMAYVSALPDMVIDAGARQPKAWDEFFAKYTYPEINFDDVVDPLGEPIMADGPLQKAAQAVVDDIVSLPDAISARWADACIRDRDGQLEYDVELHDFDTMLRRAVDARFASFPVGDDTFLNLPELIEQSSNLDEFFNNLLDKLGVCGMLDLISTAMECLTRGISLADARDAMVQAALKAMDSTHIEKIFVGLSPEAQQEIKDTIAVEYGSIPAPWESGYRQGSYNYNVTDTPEDNRTVEEKTQQYRSEAQSGGTGTIGVATANVMDALMEAYVDAILEKVSSDYLLEELNKFPGAPVVAKLLKPPDACMPQPPLFNPPLSDFMRTLELDFCRGTASISLPEIPKLEIPNPYTTIMLAVYEVILQLAIKMIMLVFDMILKILLNGICNLLGLLGDLATSLFENQPSNKFADSIKDSLSETGLSSMGMPMPLADDDTINQAAADLFGAFSRSCTEPEDLPNSEQVSSFLNEIGLVLTQGEFIDLTEGIAAKEVIDVISNLVNLRHQSFLCIFPNRAAIESFFSSLGAMVDPSFRTRPRPGAPVFPSVCAASGGAQEVDELRRALLSNKNLNSDIIDEQISALKCRAISDLEDLANILQNGIFADFPPIIDDYSDPACPIPGILPRDPSPDMMPTGPVAVASGPNGALEGAYEILEQLYYLDLMGPGGFLNMILSDRDGRNLTAHHSFIAFQAIFGLFSPRTNTHETLFPEPIGKYLEWILRNPGIEPPDLDGPGVKMISQTFTSGGPGVVDSPDLVLSYSNYYRNQNGSPNPDIHKDWYGFDIEYTSSDYDSETLNNRYKIELKEKFRFSVEPTEVDADGAPIETGEEEGEEEIVLEGDPGVPIDIEEFIGDELGLDIETVMSDGFSYGTLTYAGGTHEGAKPGDISCQGAVFGKYIEKILRDETPSAAFNLGSHADNTLEFIADACATSMFDYINTGLFNSFASIIGKDNPGFVYGEGGSDFKGNEPITYAPRKINLDGTHIHPVTGLPQPLEPLAFGGNEKFPAFYMQPPQDRPGWCGIADKMIPETDACDPKRKNIIGFKNISDTVMEFNQKIADDPRVNQPFSCVIEEPCNKILSRSASAMIEGNIKATIRIYVAEAVLKGMPNFAKFKADFKEIYENSLSAYKTQTLKEGFFLYSKKGFGRRKNDEYYFQFLEQAVQNFGLKVDANLVEITEEEQDALDIINGLQAIWKRDTLPIPSGKPYAGISEKLKRLMPPGAFRSHLMAASLGLNSVSMAEAAISKREAKKLREKHWDLFMREIEPQAEVILSRYIREELEYVLEEFSKRIPAEYKTLYEVFLGDAIYGCYGSINFSSFASPSESERPFAVAHDAIDPSATSISGDPNVFLENYLSTPPDRLNPITDETDLSRDEADERNRYWPFGLENYIFIEEYDEQHFINIISQSTDPAQARLAQETKYGQLDANGVPELWNDIRTRKSHLFGVVKASEWKAWLESRSVDFANLVVSDLWPTWSYGVRIVFVPPPQSADLSKAADIKEAISTINQGYSTEPFTPQGRQDSKAFYFGGDNYDLETNPMSIPLAKGELPMPSGSRLDNYDWYDSYDSIGGMAPLVQDMVCSIEYRMLFRYCFNMPRIMSVLAIYVINAFPPSIGRALQGGDSDMEQFDPTNLFPTAPHVPDQGEADDGWYKRYHSIVEADTIPDYYGGGRNLSPFAVNFKRWEFKKAFKRTKRVMAQSFVDLYNIEDPSYESDSLSESNTELEKNTKQSLNVSWPKHSVRLWQKKVDRPYDMNGDICYDPDEDFE